ncbi:MAG: zinc-binding alcohol dehydrogenase family protein [Oryzihumus sp.]
MRAFRVTRPRPAAEGPLERVNAAVPEPAADELLVEVLACGVCRTDLHVAEGDLAVHRPAVVPGHEVVGRVVRAGVQARGFVEGDRVGVAWLRRTCGTCRFCRRGEENLCPASTYTGWDIHGGYAEYLTVADAYVHPLPEGFSDAELAPLLCAGIIGYRALLRAEIPPGGTLGVWGFGGSAHLATQIAIAQGAVVHVFTRGDDARELALSLGAASAQDSYDLSPEPLDSAIIFAPVGDMVPPALAALGRGGTLAIAAISLTAIPSLNYARHLFQERTLRSVTANTRGDAADLLTLAQPLRVKVTTTPYSFDRADQALADLAAGRVRGAAVLSL